MPPFTMPVIQPINPVTHTTLLRYEDTDSTHHKSASHKQNTSQSLRTTLDTLFPPSQHHNRHVSSTTATRADITALTHQLTRVLAERRARPTGLCDVRNDIYNDLFHEVIRQVGIESELHGILLASIHNQLCNAVFGYRQLLDSGIQYSIEQQCEVEPNEVVDADKMNTVQTETGHLQVELARLKHQYDVQTAQLQYSDEVYERQCNEQVAYWKQLNTYLEALAQKSAATQPV